MSFVSECITALDEEGLFDSSSHRTRFKELLDCYGSYPFFSKGLCKCMYLSAWDEEHFCIMLGNLTEMTLGQEKNTKEMQNRGDALAQEQTDSQYYVYQLSCSFLEDRPFHLDEHAQVDPAVRYIIGQALKASTIIDALEA